MEVRVAMLAPYKWRVGQVVWADSGESEYGIELYRPENFWGIYFPPEDWELGVPAVIELTSLDRAHGFAVAELGLRIDVEPGKSTRVRVVPDKVGTFLFHCDVFCGSGHEEMAGRIVVVAARESRR